MADPAPEVELPGDGRARSNQGARHVTRGRIGRRFRTRGRRAVGDRRVPGRSCDAVPRAGLLNARSGNLDVVAVLERLFHERAENGIGEKIPPGTVRKRDLFRWSPHPIETVWRRDCWAAVLGP